MCIITNKSFCRSCNTVTETQEVISCCNNLKQRALENPSIWRHPSVRPSHRGFRRTCPDVTYNIQLVNLDEHCRNEAIRTTVKQRKRDLKRVAEALKTQEKDRKGVPRRKTGIVRKMTRIFRNSDRENFMQDVAVRAAARRASEDVAATVPLLIENLKQPPKTPSERHFLPPTPATAKVFGNDWKWPTPSPEVAPAPAPPSKTLIERQQSAKSKPASTRAPSRMPSVHTLPAELAGRRNAVSAPSSSKGPQQAPTRSLSRIPLVHTLPAEQAGRQNAAEVSPLSYPQRQQQQSSTRSRSRVPSVHAMPVYQFRGQNAAPARPSSNTYVPYRQAEKNWM